MAPNFKLKKKNGFSFFLDDYVETQRAKGRNISHRIGAEECALLWQNMPPEERQVYIDQASSAKKVYTQKEKETKFTSVGVSFAEMDREQKVTADKIVRADREIASTMERLNWETIRKHLFYTIHCHYLVKMEDGMYVPGEIAICEFNLESGIRKTYHRLINSVMKEKFSCFKQVETCQGEGLPKLTEFIIQGPLPVGYGYQAKLRRETVHDLPIPPYEEGVSDYLEILNDIFKFIQPGHSSSGKRPPFYAAEEDINPIENILQQFSDKVSRGENYFRVYPIHKMFFALKNKCVELSGNFSSRFPVLSNAATEIEKDTYRYVSGISCDYHTPSDQFYHCCSLSVVQRQTYVICDHCCQYLDISLRPGKHIRANADVKEEAEDWFDIPKRQIKKEKSCPEGKKFY